MALHEGDTRRVQAHHCADIHEAGAALAAAEAALWEAVDDARSQGVPWELVGRSLGVTRSAAQQRFSKPPRGMAPVERDPMCCRADECACTPWEPCERSCPVCRV